MEIHAFVLVITQLYHPNNKRMQLFEFVNLIDCQLLTPKTHIPLKTTQLKSIYRWSIQCHQARAGCLPLTFSRTMSSVAKSASFLNVPLPKSFWYESVKPSTKLNSGAQSRSAIACTNMVSIMRGKPAVNMTSQLDITMLCHTGDKMQCLEK